MSKGINLLNNKNYICHADYGASKILHMNGSLLGYINTGNQYEEGYYVDNFTPSFPKKVNSDKIKTAIALLGTAASAVYLCSKIKISKLLKIFKK